MKSHTYAALAEAVEVGLYRGWDLTHQDHTQPRKDRLLHGLLTAVMAELTKLINESETEEQP